MSRRTRFASALLVVVVVTCGSLSALPLGPRPVPAESTRIGFLTALVEWIASVFSPDPPIGDATASVSPKEGSSVDPHGGH